MLAVSKLPRRNSQEILDFAGMGSWIAAIIIGGDSRAPRTPY